jgi:hypothetical protein
MSGKPDIIDVDADQFPVWQAGETALDIERQQSDEPAF